MFGVFPKALRLPFSHTVRRLCVIDAVTTVKGHIHMAAVTATILLGGSHPNDTSVDPSYLMKLWEGDRAAWTAHSLTDPTFERRVLPKSPETIHIGTRRRAR